MDSMVSWSSNKNSFVVWNVPGFQRDLLPKYFKHKNFSSFVRQLNTYRSALELPMKVVQEYEISFDETYVFLKGNLK
ncbi:hypothetical protein Peur_062510 [Populus x canadensis]